MNLVDSCGWLEYFANTEYAKYFASAIENTKQLLVPSICIFEVFKKVLQQRGKDDALTAVALMQQGKVIDLSEPLALSAASLSINFKLAMADSIVLATAREYKAIVYTLDESFANLDGVKFFSKQKTSK